MPDRRRGQGRASIHGYTNKYYGDFSGHSYLGEWVNLGAGTHSSDLRSDYGPVEQRSSWKGERIAAGRTKVGCFVGDHSKTGLGTLLNTGTNIGAFCNLLPAGRLAGKHLPSFTNWSHGRFGRRHADRSSTGDSPHRHGTADG